MAHAPLLASILISMGAMCFSFMSLFAKMAQTQGHLSAFTLLAVRSALGLILNLIATFTTYLRERQSGKASNPVRTGQTLTPANRKRRFKRGDTKSTNGSCASDGAGGGLGICGLELKTILWLVVRATAGFGCVLLEYAALKVLPLKVNAMIVYSSPAFIVLWAAILLRQPIKAAVVALLMVSFGGLVLEVRPWNIAEEDSAPLWSYIAAVIAAALAGLVYVSLRALAGTSYLTVMNTFLTTCLVLSVAVAVPLGEFELPSAEPRLWAFLVAVGAFAYLAEVFVTCGYQRAGEGTGQVSVLKFLSPVFSMLWGCLLLGESIQWMDLAGAALILGSSAAIVLVQAKNHKGDNNPKVENPNMTPSGMQYELDLEAESGRAGGGETAESRQTDDGPPRVSFCLPKAGEPGSPEAEAAEAEAAEAEAAQASPQQGRVEERQIASI